MNIFAKLFSRRASSQPAAHNANRKKGRNEELQECLASPEIRRKLEPGEEYQLFYGGTNKGYVAAITGEELLIGHQNKITRLISGIGLPREQFHRLIYPVIKNFADYAHNLPASKAHHHYSHGGLLEHSLDVAVYAVISAMVTSFDYGNNPSLRTIRRERWYAAAAFAALLHDAGKPLNDLEVHDENREHIWPGSIPIFEWAKKHSIRNYYITWIPGRGEKHKVVNPSLVERLIPLETRDWLREGGGDIYYSMLDAIACNDQKSILTGIVIRADSLSVDQNLKTGADRAVDGGDAVVNTSSNFINAAQYLLEKGVWSANAPGARLWVTTAGIFIAWKSAVTEIVNYFDQHKIRGCPRGSDSLGAALLDNGLLEPSSDEGGLYWNVAPDVLANAETGKKLWLKCVKLSSVQTLYPFDAPPPPIAVCIGSEAEYERFDPEEGLTDGESHAFVPDDASEQTGTDKVSPMFSLDSPAPAVSSASGTGAVVATPLLSERASTIAGEASAQKRPSSQPALKVHGSKQPGTQAKAGNGPKIKKPSDLGIVLDTTGDPVGPSIVITSKGDSEAAPQPTSAVSVLQVKAPSQAAKKADKSGKKSPQPKSDAKPSPVVATQPVDDVFGDIAGIQVDFEVESSRAQTQLQAPVDEWVDPFATPGKVSAEPELGVFSEAIDGTEAGFDAAESIEITSESAGQSEPVEMRSAPQLAQAPSQFQSGGPEIDSTMGFDDFDPDLMQLLGMNGAAGLGAGSDQLVLGDAGQAAGGVTKLKAQEVDAGPVKSIPQELRFALEAPVTADLPDLPDLNPSQFSSAPAEFRVNEASQSVQRIVKVQDPVPLVIAGDDELQGFDAPEFASNVILGGMQPVFDLKSAEPEEIADIPAATKSGAQVPKRSNKDTESISKPTPQKREKAKDTGALKIGIAASVKNETASAPVIKVVGSQPAPDKVLNVGPEMHQRRRGQTPKPAKVQLDSNNSAASEPEGIKKGQPVVRSEKQYHLLPEHLLRVYTEEESRAYESFLNRTPDLRAKLQWHLESLGKSFNADAKRPFLPFCIDESEKGFKVRDLARLIEANWLWPNFMNPDDPYVTSQSRRTGFFLDGFLLECMEYLSGGSFSFEYMCFPQASASVDAGALEGYAQHIINSSKHHSVLPSRGGRIFRFTNSVLERFSLALNVKVSVLERALFSCTNYFYKNGVWLVLVAESEESYE